MGKRAPQTGSMRLVALGAAAPHEHPLTQPQLSIGSEPGNGLVIADSTVSRKHALIERRMSGYTLTDLESTNGTFVNGARLRKPLLLKPGDEIKFGAAKFAVVGGRRNTIATRHPWRLAGALAAIAALCAVGFAATYALTRSRVRALTPATKPGDETRPMAGSGAETAPPPLSPPSGGGAVSSSEPVPQWLVRVNYFRNLAKLAPLKSDPKLSDGDRKHAIYLVRNFAGSMNRGGVELGANAHVEDTANRWYTREGAAAAQSSDVTDLAVTGGKIPDPQGWAIDGWMIVPFHRLFILNPLLHRVGFGDDCENHVCVAVLNVLDGAELPPHGGLVLKHPIEFPPDGSSIPAAMRRLETEWPNPLSGCEGYSFPAGLPATLQLGPMVTAVLSSFSFSREDGSKLAACGFDADSYRNGDENSRSRVADVLRGMGAVVIVPEKPLEAGAKYNVGATVNGTEYKWSFAVAR